MTNSQNTCPALAGIAKAIVSTLSAEDLADVLKSVEPAVMQEALVRSQIVGMDPSHLQLAIDHGMIDKATILETIGHTEKNLSQVLSERSVHEIMDIMDGLHGQEDILQAMGLDGSLIGPHNEIDTDLVVSRLGDQGLESLMGSIYGEHNEEQILDALTEHVSTGDILDYFDSSDLGEAAGDEWMHDDDMTEEWLCDRLDRDTVIRYLRENL
jgi:hypothetical protein